MTDRPEPRYNPRAPTPRAPVPTNTFAIISLITAFIVPVVGIIFGHLALSAIRRTHEEGRGLAKAGLIIGYLLSSLIVAYVVFFLSVFIPLLVAGTGRSS